MDGGEEETAWKRRPKNSGYDPELFNTHAENRLWLTVTDPEHSMDTDADECKFTSLTPGKKYILLKTICKPLETILSPNGSMSIKVLEGEINKLLITTNINGTKVVIVKHKTLNLIRGEFTSSNTIKMPASEIKEELAEYRVVDVRKIEKPKRDRENKIIKNEDDEVIYEPMGKVILTFEREALPPQIKLYWRLYNIHQHEPEPVQCNKCFEYNHTKKYCPNAVGLCGWCTKAKHCDTGQRCKNPPSCRHCNDNDVDNSHPSFSKQCPRYQMEKEIAYKKETQKIPYWKAKKLVEGTDTDGTMYRRKLAKTVGATTLDSLREASEKSIADRFDRIISDMERRFQDIQTNIEQHVIQRLEQLEQVIEQKMKSIETMVKKVVPSCQNDIINQFQSGVAGLACIPSISKGATSLFSVPSGRLSKQSLDYQQMMTEDPTMKRISTPPSPDDKATKKSRSDIHSVPGD